MGERYRPCCWEMSMNGFAKALRCLALKRRGLWSDARAAGELGWSVERLLKVEGGEGSVWEMDAVLQLVGSELGRIGGVRRVSVKDEVKVKDAVKFLMGKRKEDLERCGVCWTRKGRVLGCRCDRERERMRR